MLTVKHVPKSVRGAGETVFAIPFFLFVLLSLCKA